MAIIYNKEAQTFTLQTPATTYAMHISGSGHLLHLYYGAKVPETDLRQNMRLGGAPFVPAVHDTGGVHSFDVAKLEYPTYGIGDYREPCLDVTDAAGMTVSELTYVSHTIYSGKKALAGLPSSYSGENACDTLEIVLSDKHLGLSITLAYTAFTKLDIICRSVKAKNTGKTAFDLRRILSACVELDSKDYDLITFNGTWARERYVQRIPIGYGKQQVDSCRGCTSHAHNSSVILAAHDTGETHGDCYSLGLVYSGSFVSAVEAYQYEKARAVIGINYYDFSWTLAPGAEFQAPEAVLGFSAEGLTKLSHTLHDFIRENIVRGYWKDKRRPVLINNWEGTYFDFDTEKLLAIARESAEAGIEMLVMDDGWFGKRSDDRTSLGDWEVNEEKLRGGLPHLVDEVNKLGLKFGIWFEPEMVSPISELYKAHPDWCIHVEGRERHTSRSQLVLDFSREDVREHIYGKLKAILSSANIEYVKWDMNRQITEAGSAHLPASRQREIWHRYMLGVYEMQERLLTDFPHLLLENCAGGGGRFDMGMLCYSPQIWTSDDTDAIARLKIQHGTSFCYPCSCMGAHVSAVPNHTVGRTTPFKTRGHVAMVGTFGYELDPTKLSDEEKQEIKAQIAEFDKYNKLVRTGDHYRLADPMAQSRYDAWEFVAKDKSEALFEYVQVLKEPCVLTHRMRLRGLEQGAYYRHEETGQVYSGALLMNNGIDVPMLWGDFQSWVAHFAKASPPQLRIKD